MKQNVILFFAAFSFAAPAEAAIMLQSSAPTVLDHGLVSYTLSAVSNADEVFTGMQRPSVVPVGSGLGLHQVWMPLLGATPTRGDQNPLEFHDAWRAYDSYWFFDSTNSLSIGGPFTETNSEVGGKPDLPDSLAGPARTGFGTMGYAGTAAAKYYLIASGRQGTNVALGQLVMKEGQAVLVSLGVGTNFEGPWIANFRVGEIPEPATTTLLGAALIGLLHSRRFARGR
jgi:hypothetical protein